MMNQNLRTANCTSEFPLLFLSFLLGEESKVVKGLWQVDIGE